MAAPRKYRVYTFPLSDDSEQVTFFTTKENAEELWAAIKSYKKSKIMFTGASKEEEITDTKRGNGVGIALGLHLNELTKEFELVKVDYNAKENKASITKVEPAGKLAYRAYDHFKIALIKHGVIK